MSSRFVCAASVALVVAGCGGSSGPGGGVVDDPLRCGLAVAGPTWIVEGSQARISVGCANGDRLPAGVTVRGLPAGARWDPDASVVAWSTTLSDAGVYTVEIALPTGEVAAGKLGVADAWDARDNRRPDAARYTEEYGLPVVHLEHAQALSDALWSPATLTYRGETYAVEVKYRGSRSLQFPKRSLTVSFPATKPFSDPALGIVGRKKMVLVTTFDDQTHVRNRLAFELWRRLGPGRFAARNASAVLYQNGAFQGLYMLSEKLGGQVLAAAGLNGDGNLYQAKTHAANFAATLPDGTPKLTWHDGYEKDEGAPPEGQPGAFDDLDAFVELVATADDPRFAAALPATAEVDEYRDWWVLAVLADSADSAAKNGMLYHDPRGGRWRATVWDWGASLGQDWQTLRSSSRSTNDFTGGNRLFRRLLAPPFEAGTRARLGTAVRERAPIADVLAILDGMVAETAEVARRDHARWGAAQRAFFGREGRVDWGTPEAEVAYLRRWLEERWAFLATR